MGNKMGLQMDLDWKKTGNAASNIIIILVGIVIGSWSILLLCKSISPDIIATTVGTAFTIISSVGIVVYSRKQEKIREIEQEHRIQKIPVYSDLVEFYIKFAHSTETGDKPPTQKERKIFNAHFTQRLILWGSDKTVSKYVTMNKDAKGTSGVQSAISFDKLLFLIREDLGHKNTGLKSGDLVRFFVDNLDEQLAEEQNTTSQG